MISPNKESKEQRIKKLSDENLKLIEDSKVFTLNKTVSSDSKSAENEALKRQIRVLEEKLKRQRPAERPYEQSRSKVNRRECI